jgi:hypothetical protein
MDNLAYVEMETLISNNCIDVKNIDDFEDLIKRNDNKNIFYGKRTARNLTGECFLNVFDSAFYVFTYHSKYGVYKTINDYKNAKRLNVFDAFTYYSLSKTPEKSNNFNDYLLSEYQINEITVLNYDEEKNYREKPYYLEFIKLVAELESIKEQYIFNSQQAIIAYIIKNNNNEEPSTIKKLIGKCSSGIYICDDYNLKIKLSDNFESSYSKYIEEESYFEKRGHWEYDENVFMEYINEIIKKMGIDLNIKEERKNNW